MTKPVRQALKSVGVPSVAWSDTFNQYHVRIGYSRSASGKRQRKFHYLGRDERAAVAEAAALKGQWRRLKAAVGAGAVWGDEENQYIHKTNRMPLADEAEMIAQAHADQDAYELQQGIAVMQSPRFTLQQAADRYSEYRRKKGTVKAATLINDERNLKAALSVFTPSVFISDLGYADVESWRDALLRRQQTKQISRRTFNNYLGEVRRLLDWAHRTPIIGYKNADDVQRHFAKLNAATPVNIADYDVAKLKKIVRAASDRVRLYIYLALNLGAYQSDISDLRLDEIGEFCGSAAIVRRRSKTSHQNEFDGKWVLWPETARLLQQHRARPNPMGLALLTESGRQLLRHDPHSDSISDVYLALQKRTVRLSFKQFRKIGSSAIQRIGGDEARRLYKAGTVEQGDKVYVRDSYEKLTPHLLAWGNELRRDGILF